ncbi:MAG: hypothetical protein ACOYNF_19140 [Rhodoferax sp.]
MANTKPNKTSFKPGQTGNAAGRPIGGTPRANFRKLIAPDLPEILKAVVEAAKAGDMAAANIIVSRLIPTIKPSTEDMTIRATGDLQQRGEAFISAMSTGKLSPEQATLAMGALATQAKLIEQHDVVARLDQLEAMLMPQKALT